MCDFDCGILHNLSLETTVYLWSIKMDYLLSFLAAITALVIALTGLIPIIIKMRFELKAVKESYDNVWYGIVRRGFVEGVRCSHIERVEGKWKISDAAKLTYSEISLKLKLLFKSLVLTFGRNPTDEEFAWAVEQDKVFQKWMLEHACPNLGVSQHGCLAIACIIGSENGV